MAQTEHSKLKEEIFKRYGCDPRLRLWNSSSGIFFTKTGIPVRIGVPGIADILGIRADGRLLAIEVKCGADKLRPEQIAWAGMIKKYNGLFVEARCVEDVESIL